MNKNLLAKLIDKHVLSDELTDKQKLFISANLATVLSEDAALLLIHLTFNKGDIPIVNEGEVIFAHISTSYKLKDLGDIDRLIESGMAFHHDHKYYHIGVVTGCDSYGDYNHFATNKRIKFYGLDDDFKIKTTEDSVSHTDIIPTGDETLMKLVSDDKFHTIVGKIEDIRADYHGIVLPNKS